MTTAKPSWYRTFPQGDLTDLQKIAATTTGQRGKAKQSDFFARNWWISGNAVGHTPAEMHCELGYLPGNFGQPQDVANPKQTIRVEPRPDTPGHFDTVPMILHRARLDRSPGSDHQGGLWDTDGVREWQGMIDATSPPQEFANELQADIWNALNGRPNNPQVDAYAWYCSFTPWGARGNSHTYAPAYSLWPVTLKPEDVWDSIQTGQPLPYAYGFSVDRRCSGNGPVAPHTGLNPVVDIMEDPRCWVVGGYGGSCAPARQLETVRPLAPVQLQVPDGASLALNCPPQHLVDVCIANGYVPGTIAYQAAMVMCENWVYGPGRGGVQTQTGGWMVVACDSSPAAMPGWGALGFTAANANPFRGLFASPDMLVCCDQPTSVDANGKEWRREVEAVTTGF